MLPAKITISVFAILLMATNADALSCEGHWGGTTPVKMNFLSGEKVEYCYNTNKCITRTYTGDLDKRVTFETVLPGSSVVVRKVGAAYKATYKPARRSSGFYATLTCK